MPLFVRERFINTFAQLDKKTQRAILDHLATLEVAPFKLTDDRRYIYGIPLAERLRVGSWRILYFFTDDANTEVVDLYKSQGGFKR